MRPPYRANFALCWLAWPNNRLHKRIVWGVAPATYVPQADKEMPVAGDMSAVGKPGTPTRASGNGALAIQCHVSSSMHTVTSCRGGLAAARAPTPAATPATASAAARCLLLTSTLHHQKRLVQPPVLFLSHVDMANALCVRRSQQLFDAAPNRKVMPQRENARRKTPLTPHAPQHPAMSYIFFSCLGGAGGLLEVKEAA
jgi:hypothetical protein